MTVMNLYANALQVNTLTFCRPADNSLVNKKDAHPGVVLDQLMKGAGLSANELARRSKVPQPTITRILKQESEHPETPTLQKLAKVFKVSVPQLRGEMPLRQDDAHYNVDAAPDVSAVPLISWVHAGRWERAEDPHPADGTGEKTIYTTKRVGRRAYALRIRGDSMVSESGKYTFPDGCIVVVDPDKTADIGSFIVARQGESDEATFKQLAEDAGQRYLKPLNPRYPIVPLKPDATLCGTWVQTIIDSD